MTVTYDTHVTYYVYDELSPLYIEGYYHILYRKGNILRCSCAIHVSQIIIAYM